MARKHGLLLGAALVFLIVVGAVAYARFARSERATYGFVEEAVPVVPAEPEDVEPIKPARVALPEEVRGIYWTADTARTARGEELLAYMLETGLNAVVVDVKMDNGELVWPPDALLQKLFDANVYRIARIPLMRDSAFALARPDVALHTPAGNLWRDATGAAWLDPAAPALVEEALALAREAYARGFDEAQFDYVRFASDGALSAIRYPVYDFKKTKAQVMAEFFAAVGDPLRAEGIPVSFDLFGMTLETGDDFGIGQRLVDVFDHADFISPMTYPSHYVDGFQGYANPALYPYEVVSHSLVTGAAMVASELGVPADEAGKKIRPWLQDFDIGAVYTAARIEAQIQAARDAGASGWILWNARNVYEPANYVSAEDVVEDAE